MLDSTSKFKVHEVIYDKGGFAVATGYWDGGKDLRLACRWHDPQDPNALGYPQTFGKPQWMMLPEKDIEVKCGNLLHPNKGTLTITLKG
jgi:hypothetical protein